MKGRASSAHFRVSGNPVVAGSALARERAEERVGVAGTTFVADPAGALFWPEERLLVIADLHLEKGSAFAARGVFLPPYDTATTLARLSRLVERYMPRLVIALGDSFHDGGGPVRMDDISRVELKALQRGRDWLWIAGNHDPNPAENIGGQFAGELALGALTFRHQPSSKKADGEIAGHLHPSARVAQRGRVVSRRCFASDSGRMIMPAFGAFTGGLNIRDRAVVSVFGTLSFTVLMLGERRLYAVPATRCLSD